MKPREKIMLFLAIESGLIILCTLPLFLLHAESESVLNNIGFKHF